MVAVVVVLIFWGLGFLGGGFQTNLEIPMIPYLDKIESTEPLG